MKTIAIANQKGGVGKTTVTINLAAGLALAGRRVVVVDLDAQCNATQILHRPLNEDEPGVCEVLLEEGELASILVDTATPGMQLAPAGESLANADLNLAQMMGREQYLKNILRPLAKLNVDYVLIDTGPYLGLLTINALVAADYVLVPVSSEFLPLLGLKFLLETIAKVNQKLHPKLEILGYALTMFDRRENITFKVERTLADRFGDKLFATRIRVNTNLKNAPSRKQTIFAYENRASGKGTEDFQGLTREVLARIEGG